MATITKSNVIDPAVHLERNKRALKLLRAEKVKAAKIAADLEQNISTRSRRALKIRSDVVDDIERALTGKE